MHPETLIYGHRPCNFLKSELARQRMHRVVALSLYAKWSDKQIAEDLRISVAAVKKYKSTWKKESHGSTVSVPPAK